MKAEDALEFLIVGATAVQVGTANFVNTHATTDIIDGIIDVPRVHEQMPDFAASKGEDGLIDPKHIADTMVWLHSQPRDAWTFELDLRPYREPW